MQNIWLPRKKHKKSILTQCFNLQYIKKKKHYTMEKLHNVICQLFKHYGYMPKQCGLICQFRDSFVWNALNAVSVWRCWRVWSGRLAAGAGCFSVHERAGSVGHVWGQHATVRRLQQRQTESSGRSEHRHEAGDSHQTPQDHIMSFITLLFAVVSFRFNQSTL